LSRTETHENAKTDFEQKVTARHGLGLKTVEQELTEGTEILRYLCYLLFFAFGCGYAAL
jgi:hypothetical protein